MKLLDAYLRLYESKKLYKANPCDMDSAWLIKPLGRAFERFGSQCQCCSGTRVLAAVALTAMFPVAMAYIAVAAFFISWVFEICAGPPPNEPDHPGLTD